ncbi:hypothetical protein [Salipiger bermudensis]|uniref:hypothetical protein n=1 Tax=Salipiger bermudensis TaxID=344736 RepID=UPI001CD405F4|nr:hypothetical protein [Salipiger bermudensis]MCA0961764.1 hypothetical protein [Salipiger bermudensis]
MVRRLATALRQRMQYFAFARFHLPLNILGGAPSGAVGRQPHLLLNQNVAQTIGDTMDARNDLVENA